MWTPAKWREFGLEQGIYAKDQIGPLSSKMQRWDNAILKDKLFPRTYDNWTQATYELAKLFVLNDCYWWSPLKEIFEALGLIESDTRAV